MILPLLLLALPASDSIIYRGRHRDLDVVPPRVETRPVIDGVLDEPVWQIAARLVDFSSYFPTDDRAAEDSTEVRVWYSPTAIYFGIRGYAAPASVRATLATRDNLLQDDVVTIFLGTFNDNRQAYLFAANPLGVQLDGVLVEGGSAEQNKLFGGITGSRALADPSPDFVYRSKGRLTDFGFEIEMEIPFKSIRFPSKRVQDWSLHIERTHRATGAVSTWAPAKRNTTSYLAQAGVLRNLHDLHRGLVLDVTPVVTSSIAGVAGGTGAWEYNGGSPQFGADLRWGVTTDLTVNGTVRPDFSQVESDAGQVQSDPRSALFFPEKRPFFLEGIELFDTPSNLVYTRRVVQPLGATKLTGKVSGTNAALLFAVDDRDVSASGTDHPVFGIARLQRDVGGNSRIGMLYTGRLDGSDFNHVLNADAHLAFGKRTSLDLQLAGSRTRLGDSTFSGPLWNAVFARQGRRFSIRYNANAISDRFDTESGFISRGGVANVRFVNQVTFDGSPRSLVERVSVDLSPFITWRYQDLVHGRAAQDHKYHLNSNWRFRGGWTVAASLLWEYQGFDPGFYSRLRILRPAAGGAVDTIPFTGTPTLHNVDGLLSVATPQLGGFSANVLLVWGRDVNFFEWSRAAIFNVNTGINWRPTDHLRADASYIMQRYQRYSDGSIVGITNIPRLKLEYQLTRSLFLRAVGEYRVDRQDSLRDDSRTGLPLVVQDPVTGLFARTSGINQHSLRADWLVAFQPSPGTVLFAGYGSTRARDLRIERSGLDRVADGFFIKLSYLFRM
ncbi:MAG: DUF5916 domain-containing protein [Gemmatimonadota bacterium]